MNTRVLILTLSVSGCLLQAVLPSQAQACSEVNYAKGGANVAWATQSLPSAETAAMAAGAAPAVAGATGGNVGNSQFLAGFGYAPIVVGMWRFVFTAQGNGDAGPPDGTSIDAGFQTWHVDRTELMNSGRVPATGSFCQGVWEQTNYNNFSLNHWALSWDFDPVTGKPTVFVGPTNIQERVKVDVTGMSYSGTFSITQYAADGSTVLGGVKGVMSGTRVTVD